MSKSHAVLRFFRGVHLYLGVFISPALLFFAFTGALQTFSLHETTQGSGYKPPAWIISLAQLHKKQTTVVPVRKQRPPAFDRPESSEHRDETAKSASQPGQPGHHGDGHHGGGAESTDAPNAQQRAAEAPGNNPGASPQTAKASETPGPKPGGHLPMKIFFLLVSVGLFTSTLTGIYMAYRYSRGKLLISGLLAAGIILPLLVLPF
jgi:hypothetical protein